MTAFEGCHQEKGDKHKLSKEISEGSSLEAALPSKLFFKQVSTITNKLVIEIRFQPKPQGYGEL